MSYAALRNALDLPAEFDALQSDWDASETNTDHDPTPQATESACRLLQMQPEPQSALLDAAAQLQRSPQLLRLARHCHHLLFHSPDETFWREFHLWPALPDRPELCPDLFYGLVLLSGLPHALEVHRAHGVPEQITVTTLRDFELWMNEYKKQHGRWGIGEREWLINHFKGRLFHLGRLQFELTRFPWDYCAWRNLETDAVLVLAGNGMRFRSDGQFDGANGVHRPEGAWTARYEETDDSVLGHPFSPERGAALQTPVVLPKTRWRLVLAKDTPVLGVHIPATGSLAHAECRESYEQALQFFPRHFPDFAFAAFECSSWLLDAQLSDYLPPTANIPAFLRDFYLYPIPNADDHQTLERVFGFGVEKIDPATAPRDTTLRRIVADHMQRGGHWRKGGGLILAGDLSRTPGCYTDPT
jgi:hypothetical protein